MFSKTNDVKKKIPVLGEAFDVMNIGVKTNGKKKEYEDLLEENKKLKEDLFKVQNRNRYLTKTYVEPLKEMKHQEKELKFSKKKELQKKQKHLESEKKKRKKELQKEMKKLKKKELKQAVKELKSLYELKKQKLDILQVATKNSMEDVDTVLKNEIEIIDKKIQLIKDLTDDIKTEKIHEDIKTEEVHENIKTEKEEKPKNSVKNSNEN
jgi:hypothetical protein